MKLRMTIMVLAAVAVSGLAAMDLVEGEVLCSVSDVASVLDSQYMPGRVQTPPDNGKEGHAEVINTHSGSSYWARYLMPSHIPSVDELQEGQLILWNESFADPKPSDWAYRNQIWRFGLLTSTKEAFKGVVEVNYTRGYLQWCRLPDVPQQVAFRGGEVLCAYTQEPAMENNTFATAKVQTLPSEVSRAMVEVRYANSAKGWTRYVVPSHPAKAEELKEGGWVLCSENFEKLRTELNYRYGNWYLMRITSLRDLFQDVVEANGISIPLGWVRVPEYTPEELEAIDMEEIVREAKAEEALDWIRQQRMLADWRIRKHTGRLEAKLAASGSTQMNAEDARKDLEFFAGQTQQALEIIGTLEGGVAGYAPSIEIPPTAAAVGSSSDSEAQSNTGQTLNFQAALADTYREITKLIDTLQGTALESIHRVEYHTPHQDSGDESSEGSGIESRDSDDAMEDLIEDVKEGADSSKDAFKNALKLLKELAERQTNAASNIRI